MIPIESGEKFLNMLNEESMRCMKKKRISKSDNLNEISM